MQHILGLELPSCPKMGTSGHQHQGLSDGGLEKLMFAAFDLCSIQKCYFEIHDEGINTFLLDHFEVNLVVGRSHRVASLYCYR